jgi:hypothetical protein
MQVNKLKRELETQNVEKVNWETWIGELDRTIHGFNLKFEYVICTFNMIFNSVLQVV